MSTPKRIICSAALFIVLWPLSLFPAIPQTADHEIVSITTSRGSVRVKNFYRTSTKVGDLWQLNDCSLGDCITYNSNTSTFDLSFGMTGTSYAEFARRRRGIEGSFLKTLSITRRDACKLHVEVHPINKYADFSPKFYQADFCSNTRSTGR